MASIVASGPKAGIAVNITMDEGKNCRGILFEHLVLLEARDDGGIEDEGDDAESEGISVSKSTSKSTAKKKSKKKPPASKKTPASKKDWCDQFMGFPIGWSDYSKPLATTDHSFIEDTAIPRIIQGNIPASTRLKMLGNVCVPAQGKTAMEHLWNRLNCAELTPFLEALDVGNHPRKRKRA